MITAQIESIRACWHELLEIFPTHWRELALFQDTIPLAPQRDEYFRREQDGKLFLATVRWNGKIAAYQISNVAPGFHYALTLTGTQDIVYVVPELRDKGLAFPLFRLVEREMKRRGVHIWYAGYKTSNDLGMNRLLPKLGFIPADSYLAKRLG